MEEEVVIEEKVVVVVEKGMVTEVYSTNANETVIVVDLDSQNIGENSISEFTWPETQYDDERVDELLNNTTESKEK